jgi:hypothetical protein
MPVIKNHAVFKIRIQGPSISPGSISVPDLIRICEQAQAAVNRQAEALEGEKNTLRTGPIRAHVKRECTLELIRISKGSTVLHFGFQRLAELAPDIFESQVELGKEAVFSVVSTIGSLANRKPNNQVIDAGVADSLVQMGKVLGPVTRLQFTMPRERQKPLNAIFDEKTYVKILARAEIKPGVPAKIHRQINGVVEMADFKVGDHKCRLVPLFGSPVTCSFTEELEDSVTKLVRKAAIASGLAIIDPRTSKIESFEISDIEPLEPVLMQFGDFGITKTVDELIREQGTKPLKSVSQLHGIWIDPPGRVN